MLILTKRNGKKKLGLLPNGAMGTTRNFFFFALAPSNTLGIVRFRTVQCLFAYSRKETV
jgi:hypothetical protein